MEKLEEGSSKGHLIFSLLIIQLITFQYLFVEMISSYFKIVDDLILFLLIPFVFHEIILKKPIKIVLIFFYFLSGFITAYWSFSLSGILKDFLWLIKPVILISGAINLFNNLSKNELSLLKRILTFCVYIAIVFAFCQFIFWYLFRIELPMSGDKFVSGVESFISEKFALRRVKSFFGHTLWLGYVCCAWLIYSVRSKKYLLSFCCSIGILLSFSRWAAFLAMTGVFIVLFQKNKTWKIVLSILFVLVVIVLIVYMKDIIRIYNVFWGSYNTKAIKMMGIKDSFKYLKQNPFGYGFGNFGTYNSVYSFLTLKGNIDSEILSRATSGIEAMFFINLIQVGLCGSLIWLYLLVNDFMNSKNFCYCFIILIFPLIGNLYIPVFLIHLCFLSIIMKKSEKITVSRICNEDCINKNCE